MKQFEIFFKSHDNKCIYSQCWCPDENPEAVLMLLHDAGEHSGRYEKWAKMFVKQNIGIIAMDYRGHGKSEGTKGNIKKIEHIVKDTGLLLLKAEKEYPGIPKILYGQGIGGNIALYSAIKKKYNYNGIIATSPWLKASHKSNRIYETYSKFLKRYIPKFGIKYILNVTNLTNNPDVINSYYSDPLIYNQISSHLLKEIKKMGNYIISRKYKINTPVLIMHGSNDSITSSNESFKFGQNSNHIQVKIWQGKLHELHHDIDNIEIFNYTMKWIKESLLKQRPDVNNN